MHIFRNIGVIALSFVLWLPCTSNADIITVPMPALDIQSSDSGAVMSEPSIGNYEFDIQSTAIAIVSDTHPDIDIADQTFTLHGIFDSSTNLFAGTFSVGGGLLAGEFDNLFVEWLSGIEVWKFHGDMLYTSGSLKGDLEGGVLLGSGDANGLSAKLGEITVVPVPAAAWLFGSGLLGLVGIARRKTA